MKRKNLLNYEIVQMGALNASQSCFNELVLTFCMQIIVACQKDMKEHACLLCCMSFDTQGNVH